MTAERKSRKELTAEYKQRKPEAGVFQIRNRSNGKIFIGSTTTLETIWNSQRFRLAANSHPNPALQTEWNAMGPDPFEFSVLHLLEPRDDTSDIRAELKTLEQLTLDELQPFGDRG